MQEQRRALLDDRGLVGRQLRDALSDLYDRWLSGLLGDPAPGLALVAVGSLGRRECAPGSDVDLVLVHDPRRDDVGAVADRLWYAVWDSGVGLDHSVRTVAAAVQVTGSDLRAALGLLDARHVAGDPAVTAALITAVRAAWRRGARARLPELHEQVRERARTAGEVAFLLEPDLVQARGGLRDVAALGALAVAQVADSPGAAVVEAAGLLLDVRGELHRRAARTGSRVGDLLLLQEQDAVAAPLGFADADALVAAVTDAARTIAYASDGTWRRSLAAARRRPLGSRRRRPARRPLALDVVEQEGEVVLARDAQPADDPGLVLQVARAAAQANLPIAPATLSRLTERRPPLPDPWPRAALDALLGLLAAGPSAVPVFEALDRAGLLVALLPEWTAVRSRPQRTSWHRYTVDRHLVETAAVAAGLTRRVARPDLLLLAALLHDLGKGVPGDHSVTGAALAGRVGARLGLATADVDVLVALVRHHLLLPDVATRRDLDDPATVAGVARSVGSATVLELLAALTEADARATGPGAWTAWRAALVARLVDRVGDRLAGVPPPPAPALTPEQERLMHAGAFALDVRDDEVTIVASDRPGLLAVSTGVLALHRLDVLSAWAGSRGRTAISVLRVAPRFGVLPDWDVVRDCLRRTLDGGASGSQALRAALRAREQAYARRAAPAAPARVRLIDDATPAATVVEVHASDRLGVLHHIASALHACDLDVRTAHISTLGADVVDAFYVVGPDGGPLRDPAHRRQLVQEVLVGLA